MVRIDDEAGDRVNLAHVPPFKLGDVEVHPPTRQLIHAGRSQTLEPRVMQVLVALAQAGGAVLTHDELIDRCWNGRIVSETAIRRTISRIRELSDTFGNGTFKLETITKVGYRMTVDSPNGTVPTGPAVSLEAQAKRRSRVGAAATAAFLVTLLVLGFWLWPRSLPDRNGVPAVRVELADISPEVPQELPEALREELIAAFDMNDAVTLLTSAGVGEPKTYHYRLGGSIRQSEGHPRFVMRLTGERSGAILWSGAYDYPSAMAPRAVRDVASKTSQIVRCGLWGASTHPRPLPERALSLYLQLCEELWLGGNQARLLTAARRIVAASPDFSRGWSGLAFASAIVDVGEVPEALRVTGDRAADRALRLDASNSEAWMAKALLHPWRDFAGRERLLRRALGTGLGDDRREGRQFRPSEHQYYAMFLAGVGRTRDAIFHGARAQAMLPLSWHYAGPQATILVQAGQAREANQLLEEAIGQWPDRGVLHQVRGRLGLGTEFRAEALQSIAAPETGLSSQEREIWTAAVGALRSRNSAERALVTERLVRLAQSPATNSRFVVNALGAIGRNQEALAAAEALIAGSGSDISMSMLFDPTLAAARQMPEFAALAERLGLTAYWRHTGKLPDFCRQSGAPGLCRRLA